LSQTTANERFWHQREDGMGARTGRATVLGAAGSLLAGAAAVWLLDAAAGSWPGWGPAPVGAGLVFLTTGLGAVGTAWACLLLGTATVSLARQGPEAPASPAALDAEGARHGLTGRVAAGLLVAASLGVAPATAAEPASPGTVACQPADAGEPSTQTPLPEIGPDPRDTAQADGIPVPGWTPTVTTVEPARAASGEVGLVSTSATSTPGTDEVVVHRGDTLWDIAARHLGDQATDQDVAEAWPRWYAANRDVVGDDPDLLHPGQRLVVPAQAGAR